MAKDERIKANEWEVKKRCPICTDIATNKINLEGDQLYDDPEKKQPMFCPNILDRETGQMCGHLDIRIFHEIGSVEIARTSTRGDTQPWAHITVVRCMSCDWRHVVSTNPCLGNPWDEVMGFARPMDQSKETKRKIRFSNEQAVGLRAHDEKYSAETSLKSKRYKSTRKVRSHEEGGKASPSDDVEFTYVPTKEEKRLPRFKKDKKQTENKD
jgi:hypothetical protein